MVNVFVKEIRNAENGKAALLSPKGRVFNAVFMYLDFWLFISSVYEMYKYQLYRTYTHT